MLHRWTKFREEKLKMLIKKVPDTNGLMTTTTLNTITGDAKNKIPDTSG